MNTEQASKNIFTYTGKLCLSKGIATFASAFLPKLPNQKPSDSSD